MAKTSSKTRIGKVIDYKVRSSEILYAFSSNEDIFLNHLGATKNRHLFLAGHDYDADKIPLFTTTFHHRVGSEKYIITDLRPFISTGSKRGIGIRNKMEAEMYIFRSVLEDVIEVSGPEAVRDTFIETVPLYGWYISSILSSSLNLPTYMLPSVSIVAQAYYLNSISDTQDYEKNKESLALRIARMNKFSNHDVSVIVESIHIDDSINSLIEAIKKTIDSPRAESLNYGTFIAMLASSYFGYDQNNVPPIAVESPAMWIPFVSCVFRDRTKKRCMAAKIITNYSSKAEQFNIRKKLYQTLDTVLPDFEKELLE